MKRLFVVLLLITLAACIVDPPPSPLPTPTLSPLGMPVAENRAEGGIIISQEDTKMDFWNAVLAFFYGSMLPTILGLVALDIVFGIAASLKAGEFDWGKVGQFYKTMVAPYVLVYLAVFVGLALVPELEEYVTAVGISIATLFSSVTINLLASIVKNIAKLGLGAGA